MFSPLTASIINAPELTLLASVCVLLAVVAIRPLAARRFDRFVEEQPRNRSFETIVLAILLLLVGLTLLLRLMTRPASLSSGLF